MDAVDGCGCAKDGLTYGSGPCIEAVLDKLFDGGLEVNDDLARGDAVDRVCVDRGDGGSGHVCSCGCSGRL